jgi:hypothetical protein
MFFTFLRKAARGAAFAAVIAVICAALFAGCSDDSGDDTSTTDTSGPTITSVTITPSSPSVVSGSGSQVVFQAWVTWSSGATDTSVNWSASEGTINPATPGTAILNIPASKTSGNIIVTARSAQAPSKFASANVTIVAPGSGNPVSVAISPPGVGLSPGESQQFYAQVFLSNGAIDSSNTVVWDVSYADGTKPGGTTISSTGYLTVSGTENKNLIVRAWPASDPTKIGPANVIITGSGQTVSDFNVSFNPLPPQVPFGSTAMETLVTVSNTGNVDPGRITVSGSGSSGVRMEIGAVSNNGEIPSMTNSCNFKVSFLNGMPVGQYTATITVRAANISTPKTITINFTVVEVTAIKVSGTATKIYYAVGEAATAGADDVTKLDLSGLTFAVDYRGGPNDVPVTAEINANKGLYLTVPTDSLTKPSPTETVTVTVRYPLVNPVGGTFDIAVQKLATRINNAVAARKSETILLYTDEEVAAGTPTIEIKNNTTITLKPDKNEARKITSKIDDASLFTVASGSNQLILEDKVTLDGDETENTASLVTVPGGALTMRPGSVITGYTSATAGKSAVEVSGGSFTMGGTITGNKNTYTTDYNTPQAGGLTITNGSFSMVDGGKIYGNLWGSTAADVYRAGGNFDLIGGSIYALFNAGVFNMPKGDTPRVRVLTLFGTSPADRGTVSLSGALTGTLSTVTLNLYGGVAQNQVIPLWYNNPPIMIITGLSPYRVSASDLGVFELGKFYSSVDATGSPISNDTANEHNSWGGTNGNYYEFFTSDAAKIGALEQK